MVKSVPLYLQINKEDKDIGYFPLFQARSLQEKKDDALTELAELKKLMSKIEAHHREEVGNKIFFSKWTIILFVV